MNPANLAHSLEELLARRASPERGGWVTRVGADRTPFDRDRFLTFFASATRDLGKDPLELSGAEAEALRSQGIDWPPALWGLDEVGRVALLLRAGSILPEDGYGDLVEGCYRQGEIRERTAVVRALAILPGCERFLPLAIDACRSHIQPVFEAIACENPYPERYFPEPNFNQMVLKAVFIGVALDRVLGLDRRLTSELARMANDYAREREAAGRTVPTDLELLTQGAGRDR
jgi:hypothetical protein